MIRTSLLLTGTILLFACWVPSGYATTTWVVDDDRVECPTANFTTIQAGVAAASTGDTIQVCPGTYKENVSVDKANLIINASGARGAVKLTTPALGGPQSGFTISANNVTIQGFEIYNFCDTSETFESSGISISRPADAAVIRQNNIHDNCVGISLFQSNNNQIVRNEIHHNHATPVFGLGGFGVKSFNGNGDAEITAANAAGRSGKNNFIANNFVHDSDLTGVWTGGCTGPSGCSGNGSGSTRLDQLGTQVTFNQFSNNGADVHVQAADRVGVRSNRANVGTSGFGSIELASADYVTVEANQLSGRGAKRGIVLRDSTHNFVHSNLANNLFNGMAIFDLFAASTANLVKENTTNRNSHDGIAVFSSLNSFVENTSLNNNNFDVEDNTTGSGTAGTQNQWFDTNCNLSHPSAICD